MAKLAKMALVLAIGLLLTAGAMAGQKGDKAKCLADCKAKCTKTYNTCLKKATNDTAKKSCQESRDLCNSVCVNQECR